MKTNPLKALLFVLSIPWPAQAGGFNTFECLRDIMAATDRGSHQGKRRDVERPFMLSDRYMVFPEVVKRKLTGFFLYDGKSAWYYDTIKIKMTEGSESLPIAVLPERKDRSLYQMVAQPAGLETVTLYYMPGFDANETNSSGPVMLGTSILPVIGAFVSRPEKYDSVYQNPEGVPEHRLQEWLAQNSKGRQPAKAGEMKIERKIVHLSTTKAKDEKRLWQPLKEELELRKAWLEKSNLDNQTFKQLAPALEGSCKR